MDILTYIDRVKANYSKQPEPVYNTKKYFTGGRVGFDKGGDVENLKKLLKSNDPKFFEKFKKIQNKHFNGNFKTTAESIGNMEAIKAKFNRANIEQGGQGTKLKTTIEPKGETLRQTDFTTKLNKNPDMLKKYSKSKEYLTINNLANKVGIDISKRKDRDYLTRTLLELGIENKPLTANIKEYSLSDFAKKINYKTKIKGEQKSQSVRNKNISKVDPELNALEKKIINNVARSSKQEGVFIARAVEDAGHAVSVNVANKYPKLIKDSNILDIQSRVYQDPKVNMTILNKKGFDSRFDSVFKELNSLVNKPVTKETRKQLINLKNKMSSIRNESIEAIKTEAKEFPYLKGQEKRIPKLDIKIPDVGQKFESKNLFADMSVVDQQYRVGKINTVNRSAKKLTDLNPQELEKYKTNMFAQNSDNVQKFYTAIKDKKTGQAVFSKVDIADLGEAIEAVGCPNNKAMGGRAEFNTGTTCFLKGQKAINSGKIAKGAQARNFAKFANSAYKLGRGVMKFGVIPEALFVSADSLIRMGMGDTLDESLLRAADYLIPGNQTRKADISKIKRGLGFEASKVFENVENWRDKNNELESLKQSRDSNQNVLSEDPYSYTSNVNSTKQLEIDNERIKDKEKEVLDASVSASADEQVLSSRYADEGYDISRAGSKSSMARSVVAEDESGLNRDLIAPEREQKNLNKRMSPINFMQTNLYTEEDLFKTANQLFQISGDMKKAQKYYDDGLKEIKRNKTQPLSKIVLDNPNSGVEEQVYGASGPDSFLRKINQPRPYERKATYRPNPFSDISEQSDIYDMGRQGAATGGLANLTTKTAPKKGPQSEGLAYFMKHGRK